MKRAFLYLSCIALIIMIAPCIVAASVMVEDAGTKAGVTVTPPAISYSGYPLDQFTMTFNVRNDDGAAHNFTLELIFKKVVGASELPSAWGMTPSPDYLMLSANQNRAVQETITIPAGMANGTYKVVLQATAKDDSSINGNDFTTITVNKKPVISLEIDGETSPNINIKPGESIEKTLNIINKGNDDANVALNYELAQGNAAFWSFSLDTTMVQFIYTGGSVETKTAIINITTTKDVPFTPGASAIYVINASYGGEETALTLSIFIEPVPVLEIDLLFSTNNTVQNTAFTVTAVISNEGGVRAENVRISFHGGSDAEEIYHENITRINPGQEISVEVKLTVDDFGKYPIEVRVTNSTGYNISSNSEELTIKVDPKLWVLGGYAGLTIFMGVIVAILVINIIRRGDERLIPEELEEETLVAQKTAKRPVVSKAKRSPAPPIKKITKIEDEDLMDTGSAEDIVKMAKRVMTNAERDGIDVFLIEDAMTKAEKSLRAGHKEKAKNYSKYVVDQIDSLTRKRDAAKAEIVQAKRAIMRAKSRGANVMQPEMLLKRANEAMEDGDYMAAKNYAKKGNNMALELQKTAR